MGKNSEAKDRGRGSDSVFSTLFQMFGVAVVTITAYHLMFSGDDQNAADDTVASGIVVVDTKVLVQAQIDAATQAIAAGAQMSEAQLKAQGQNFGAEFLKSVRRYSDTGLIVLDKKFAVGVPSQVDVTMAVAADLGLEVEIVPDPFTTPVASR